MGLAQAGPAAELDAIAGKKLSLVEELAERTRIDQEVRRALHSGLPEAEKKALLVQMGEVDQRNGVWLRGLVESGWPTLSEHGLKASQRAWLLVQHSDKDVELQERVLAVLEGLLEKKEVRAKEVAYLHDRVATNRSRDQRYGTQGRCLDGSWGPNPTEEPEQLDARRAEVGLKSMAAYQSMFDCDGKRALSDQAYKKKDWATCHTGYVAYATSNKGPGAANAWYNAACCASLDGDVVEAMSHLKAAFSEGLDKRERVESDADLKALRATDAFKSWWKE